MIIHRRIKITGSVQGVFYRVTAAQRAKDLNLTGWIMNEEDRSVVASVQGEEDKVNEFIQWCWQGPPMAQVTNIDVEECVVDSFKRFEIRR